MVNIPNDWLKSYINDFIRRVKLCVPRLKHERLHINREKYAYKAKKRRIITCHDRNATATATASLDDGC